MPPQCLYPPPATTLHVTPHCNGVTQQVYCYTSSQAAAARDSSVAMGPRCHVITDHSGETQDEEAECRPLHPHAKARMMTLSSSSITRDVSVVKIHLFDDSHNPLPDPPVDPYKLIALGAEVEHVQEGVEVAGQQRAQPAPRQTRLRSLQKGL